MILGLISTEIASVMMVDTESGELLLGGMSATELSRVNPKWNLGVLVEDNVNRHLPTRIGDIEFKDLYHFSVQGVGHCVGLHTINAYESRFVLDGHWVCTIKSKRNAYKKTNKLVYAYKFSNFYIVAYSSYSSNVMLRMCFNEQGVLSFVDADCSDDINCSVVFNGDDSLLARFKLLCLPR